MSYRLPGIIGCIIYIGLGVLCHIASSESMTFHECMRDVSQLTAASIGVAFGTLATLAFLFLCHCIAQVTTCHRFRWSEWHSGNCVFSVFEGELDSLLDCEAMSDAVFAIHPLEVQVCATWRRRWNCAPTSSHLQDVLNQACGTLPQSSWFGLPVDYFSCKALRGVFRVPEM